MNKFYVDCMTKEKVSQFIKILQAHGYGKNLISDDNYHLSVVLCVNKNKECVYITGLGHDSKIELLNLHKHPLKIMQYLIEWPKPNLIFEGREAKFGANGVVHFRNFTLNFEQVEYIYETCKEKRQCNS